MNKTNDKRQTEMHRARSSGRREKQTLNNKRQTINKFQINLN
jgi:hypothetical protein